MINFGLGIGWVPAEIVSSSVGHPHSVAWAVIPWRAGSIDVRYSVVVHYRLV
jgi:hypothetical protein